MSEVICAFGWRELFEDCFQCVADGVERPWCHPPEQGFDFGEHLLDGVEVRTVGRKIEQLHSGTLEALADTGDFMGWQIVDDDDAARLHLGNEAFFEPLLEDHAGHGTRQQLRGEDGVMGQAGQERRRHPVAMRRLADKFLALLAPTVRPRHCRIGAGFIDEYQRREVQVGLCSPPEGPRQRNVRPVLLRRKDRFF